MKNRKIPKYNQPLPLKLTFFKITLINSLKNNKQHQACYQNLTHILKQQQANKK